MPQPEITIRGAREHNLQDVDLVLPRNQLICFTGVSGSGKSSLAFDTLYAEGQRRYIESLSTFARQFLGQLPKPDVDFVGGLSPAISISQKASGHNPRSTVGTITEIYDFLRVLYARVGTGFCPTCDVPIAAQTREQIVTRITQLPSESALLLLAPLVRQQKGEFADTFEDLQRQGFARARVDGRVVRLSSPPPLERQKKHDIEVVVDRFAPGARDRSRLFEAVETALKLGDGSLLVVVADPSGIVTSKPGISKRSPAKRKKSSAERDDVEPKDISVEEHREGESNEDTLWSSGQTMLYSARYACAQCGTSYPPPSPQLFSFNSPQGMCPSCDGLGRLFTFVPHLLVPDPSKSFEKGAIELVGAETSWGRYRRHVYNGVAETMERFLKLPEGTLLTTPWRDLKPELQRIWFWGTGEQHITFTWRAGSKPMMYGGKFGGVIPELLTSYREAKAKSKIESLEQYMDTLECDDCRGSRLNAQARFVRLTTLHSDLQTRPSLPLPQLCELSITDAVNFFEALQLNETEQLIAGEVLKEVRQRLGFLVNVGLGYLTLARTAPTLSGGETQRIRLASQVGSGLVGVLYVLDEPSIGLHPRDNDRLIDTLLQLRDAGNTLVVVEHDEDTMLAADLVVDFGPGPGVHGGEVVGMGRADELVKQNKSLTGRYLSGDEKIEIPTNRRPPSSEQLAIRGATQHNLRDVDVEIPLGRFVCVTGVSGSGKSSLITDILEPALRIQLMNGVGEIGAHRVIEGIDRIDKCIAIDQSPIGRTPRSNPATYVKVFDEIRDLFAQLPDAKRRGYLPGRFSFNVDGGRCTACEGNGATRLEMDFLADVWVTCPVCEGRRYNRETLEVKFKGKSIAEVLDMNSEQAIELFANIPKIADRLKTLDAVGLAYLKLGQPSPTLSGGEAQRIKLSRELSKKATGRTVYVLDEPTTGLHFADIKLLLKVLHDLVERGNTVIVVEHNLDVIKTADWVIDLGPEGGAGGGLLVACGTPETIAQCDGSHTGRALQRILSGEPPIRWQSKHRADQQLAQTPSVGPTPDHATQLTATEQTHITVEGASQHNLRSVDVRIPREAMTVFCGPSGSGKSSLAMDTIYAEGQRRYVESLSSYARQFVGQLQKPKVERVEGLSPAIALEQKNLGHSPRSTVGTVTEIHDYLRVLMARLGQPFCPSCQVAIGTQTSDQIVDKVMALPAGTRALLLAPRREADTADYPALWARLKADGYQRVRIDGTTYAIDEAPVMDVRSQHQIQIVVDRLTIRSDARSRINDSVELALGIGGGICQLAIADADKPEPKWKIISHSQHLACDRCGRSFEPLTPHHFSFNSAAGWCPSCQGLGTQTGTNPTALLRDGRLTLAKGALLLWPDLQQPMAMAMLRCFARHAEVPLDVPWDELSPRHRRQFLHGAGDEWLTATAEDGAKNSFQFRFKGLYPSLESAARLNPSLRGKLQSFVAEIDCSTCDGSRLRDDAASVQLFGQTIAELMKMPLGRLLEVVKAWKPDARGKRIGGELFRSIKQRLQFLTDVGLEYLTLGRPAATLSGGEAQRIRLAAQLGSGLCGVLYVLDEPTVGLHPRDNLRLLGALHRLRDAGNTLLVVEHDRDVIAGADQLCDFGPGAGRLGGRVVSMGTPRDVADQSSGLTGEYLSGKRAIEVPTNRRMIPIDAVTASVTATTKKKGSAKPRSKSAKGAAAEETLESTTAQRFAPPGPGWLTIRGARENNLKGIDVSIPLGALVAITGPSGSGKSSLVEDVLYPALARKLHRATMKVGRHDGIEGLQHIDKVIRVDQSPLGNTPSSNPATYTGVFELIRTLYSQMPTAKMRGYTTRQFSFNVSGGRCEACEGTGQRRIEMHFLPDVWVTCEGCKGKRYTSETLEVQFHGHSISDVLDLPCGDAVRLFENQPKIARILQTLCDVGLSYVTLGQSAPTLSGGEAQRVKLAAELSRPDTGRTLYLLDEPTTGLHFDDIAKLLRVVHRLVDLGNTVCLIEHNLDVIKQADWIIDLGPEAGAAGGEVVVASIPEAVVAYGKQKQSKTRPSHTAAALAPVIEAGPRATRVAESESAARDNRSLPTPAMSLRFDGKQEKVSSPWEADGRTWHLTTRLDRAGKPLRWEGKILEAIIEKIEGSGVFPPIKWAHRSIVEVPQPTGRPGAFMRAITAETWLLKLRVHIPRGTFKKQDLLTQVPLKTLNELSDVPRYSNAPRIETRIVMHGYQEVEWDLHSWEEVNVPGFWKFLHDAIASVQSPDSTQSGSSVDDAREQLEKLKRKV
jgi:excinuclease ABC subunit A